MAAEAAYRDPLVHPRLIPSSVPFTPSHAVVALPFVRTPLVPAAIAVGAMTPDLPLFTRNLPLPYVRTHDLMWVPVTLVLALALLLLWRCVLRPAARELSPEWLAVRLPGEWDRGAGDALGETFGLPVDRHGGDVSTRRASASALLLLGASLALGIASHILWDAFTHEGRWGVAALPALGVSWGPLLGYKWLQHGSTALGLVIIAAWTTVWLSRRDAAAPVARVVPDAVRWVWWASLPVALAGAWLLGLGTLGPLDAEFTIAHLAYRVLPPACGIWGALSMAIAVAVQVVRGRRRPVAAGGL